MNSFYGAAKKKDGTTTNIKIKKFYKKHFNITINKNQHKIVKVKSLYFNHADDDDADHTIQDAKDSNKMVYNEQCFYRSIGPIIYFTQFFSLMPIDEVLNKDLSKIRFKWCSFHTVYAIAGLTACTVEFVLFLHHAFGPNFNLSVFGGFIYFITLVGSQYILFFKSIHWNELMNRWIQYESIFFRRPYQHLKYKMKLNIVGLLIFFATIVEHFLNVGVNNYVTYTRTKDCNLNVTYGEAYYYYFKHHYYKIYPYSLMLLIYAQAVDFLNAINRSLIDVLIISFSIAIVSYFTVLNKRICEYGKRETTESFWIGIREHYVRIADLVRYIDHEFRFIILFSCTNNLYFICDRLYSCFGDFSSLFAMFTYWFTFLFLLVRTVTVLFIAAGINDVSVESLAIVRQIPSSSWSIEVHRFMEQLLQESIAFSGNKYFYITRRSIFTMACTIITFEIVLLNQLKRTAERTQNCDLI